MNFKTYWKDLTPAQKIELAEKSATSVAYLSHIANGHRKAGANLLDRILVAEPNLTYQMMRWG